jgi:hypothetical protein
MDKDNTKREQGPAIVKPALDEDDFRMNVNDNPRANENLDATSFDQNEEGGVGSEITDGEAS